ncbi:methyltransferase, FxLD system [Actinoallomurus sp. NPDC052274]|uniref:methyltransferase, FxLD system n=1 Tax=Actinoallomurus sp. NPDC052274 TaxID=3155420 RepID=UPI0034345D6E
MQFRDALADKLVQDGVITSAAVERAVRTVPRHRFVPAGTSLEVAYNAYQSVQTKTDQHGVRISSVSEPFIQARMIEQAELVPGGRVLEIGSGGYNAALLAEVVGVDGRVVSVDIDEEVTSRAREALEATGYGSRVTVVTADATGGISVDGPYDAVIVTVGAWDIHRSWTELLAEDGRLVVPLRMNGITRVIAFRPAGDHLVSTSATVAGFVPVQGVGEHRERVFSLPDPQSRRSVKLQFDDEIPDDLDLLHGVLATPWSEVWSGVTTGSGESFADLHLWFACHLPGFCRVAADEGIELGERGRWFPFGAVRGDSFAYLVVRSRAEGGFEFGARAYGVHGEDAAAGMVAQIQEWDIQAQHGDSPTFGYWPAGSDPWPLAAGTTVLEKPEGLVTISWPVAS